MCFACVFVFILYSAELPTYQVQPASSYARMADEREIGSFQTYIFDDHHGWHIIWIMEYKNGDGKIWTVISGVNLDGICFHFSFSESFYIALWLCNDGHWSISVLWIFDLAFSSPKNILSFTFFLLFSLGFGRG